MSATRGIKRFIAGTLSSDAVTSLMAPLTHGVASILMLHRFADPDRGNSGHDRNTLRTHLAYLRRKRYELVGVAELIARLESGDSRLSKTVAFTIDDGYADYATIGAPVFEEFDCPATVFIVSGITDTHGWYWWDRLRVALETADRQSLTVEIGGTPLRLAWTDAAGANRAARALIDRIKLVPDTERRRVLDAVPALVGGEVPVTPPPRYASMTWDEIRACGRGVTTFGAHTVSHPILARTDDAVARAEIEGSWNRVRAETDAAVPVFCYPNGGPNDVTARETTILTELELAAAVTSRPGYASPGGFRATPDARYLVPRFPYGGDRHELVQVVSGVERMKLVLRRSVVR